MRQGARLRVATKYMQTAREHFAAKGVHVDLIKLYGSMELAPLMGLADAIVDLVATGNTLRANRLHAVEEIMPISARLIVNQAALKLKRDALQPLLETFAQAVSRHQHAAAYPPRTRQRRLRGELARAARVRGHAGRERRAHRRGDPRRRARARRCRGARVHAALRPRRGRDASPTLELPQPSAGAGVRRADPRAARRAGAGRRRASARYHERQLRESWSYHRGRRHACSASR